MPSSNLKARPASRSPSARRWRVPIAVAAAVAVALTVGVAVRAGRSAPSAAAKETTEIILDQPGGSQVGEQAPRLHATTSTGSRFTLPVGKPAVLLFVTAWCNPVLEVSALGRIHRDLGERVAILGVGVDPTEPLGDLRDFAARQGAGFGFAHDRDGALTSALAVHGWTPPWWWPEAHAQAANLTCANYLPVGRARRLLGQLTGLAVSDGWVAGVRGKAAGGLDGSSWSASASCGTAPRRSTWMRPGAGRGRAGLCPCGLHPVSDLAAHRRPVCCQHRRWRGAAGLSRGHHPGWL